MSTPVPDELEFEPSAVGTGSERAVPGRSAVNDPFCIVVWHFECDNARVEEFEALCESLPDPLPDEPKCLFRRVSRDGNAFQIRLGFEDAFGVLTHVVNFSETLEAARSLARSSGLEIHGTGSELAMLSEPLGPFEPLLVEQDFSEAV